MIKSMTLHSGWEVLVLFLIPIGGGIPAGVLLAQSRGIEWPYIMALYFLSDVILACCFEPFLKLCIYLGPRYPVLIRIGESFQETVKKSMALYGNRTGPLALVLVAFGIDPMTGRSAAMAAGHGFVVGWLIAITGDMIYFTILMASTLWLRSVLGDGTWTMVIILVVMVGVPYGIRRYRESRVTPPPT